MRAQFRCFWSARNGSLRFSVFWTSRHVCWITQATAGMPVQARCERSYVNHPIRKNGVTGSSFIRGIETIRQFLLLLPAGLILSAFRQYFVLHEDRDFQLRLHHIFVLSADRAAEVPASVNPHFPITAEPLPFDIPLHEIFSISRIPNKEHSDKSLKHAVHDRGRAPAAGAAPLQGGSLSHRCLFSIDACLRRTIIQEDRER